MTRNSGSKTRYIFVGLLASISLSVFAQPAQQELPPPPPSASTSAQQSPEVSSAVTTPPIKPLLSEKTAPPPKPAPIKNTSAATTLAQAEATPQAADTATETTTQMSSQPVVTTEAVPASTPATSADSPQPAAAIEEPTGLVRPGTLTLTVGGGVDFFAQNRMLNNAGVPFASLGYDFTKRWGVQMFYGIFNTQSQNVSAGKPWVHGAIFAFDGVYHMGQFKTIDPYLLFGAGIIGLSYNNNDANNQGNINAGLGLKYFLNNKVGFSLEGRDFYTTVGGKNDILFDAGLSLMFDFG